MARTRDPDVMNSPWRVADESFDGPPAARTGVPGWVRLVVAVLGVALLALIVLLIIELVRGPAKPAADRQSLSSGATSAGSGDRAGARSAALQEAITDAAPLLSYDYRSLDRDLAAAKAVTTGDFASAYGGNVPAIKSLAAKTHAVVKATVLGAAVVDDTKLTAIKVLVFVDQVVTNTQLAAPRVDSDRVVLTMRPVGSTWKVAAVDAI